MKGIIAILTALFFAAPLQGGLPGDESGHSLERLWKEYRSAQNADAVGDGMRVLEKIRRKASSEGLYWDWYDASREYCRLKTASNWKLRESSHEQFKKEADRIASPIAGFAYRLEYESVGQASAFVREHHDAFVQQHNPAFYSLLPGNACFAPVLRGLLQTDLHFALWALALKGGDDYTREQLPALVKDSYPANALWDFWQSRSSREELQSYSVRYKGSAASLLAQEELLLLKKNDLDSSKRPSSGDYIALKNDCEDFLALQASFKGGEADLAACCKGVRQLARELEASEIRINVRDETIELSLRNLVKAQLSILNEDTHKKVFSTQIDNPAGSFYVFDTISVALPPMDDGDYLVRCSSGRVSSESFFSRNSLSLVARRSASGIGVYLADSKTGEPVKQADLILKDPSGKEVTRIPEFCFCDVFTPLGVEVNGSISALCTGDGSRLRRSSEVTLLKSEPASSSDSALPRTCIVLTDKAAFKPGETVHFKAILCEGRQSRHTIPEGTELSAVLTDPRGKELAEKALKTDAFGAVYSSFLLERTERNGNYSIQIRQGGIILASTLVSVGDFILPEFDLIWDEDTRHYLPGDEVQLTGTLRSFAGVPLSEMSLEYSVEGFEPALSGKLRPSSDGRFCISFTAGSRSRYSVKVRAVDTGGQTFEFTRNVSVSEWFPAGISLSNRSKGRLELPGRQAYAVMLSEDVGHFSIKLPQHPSLQAVWTLMDEGGTVLRKGDAAALRELEVDFSSFPEALYSVRLDATLTTASGKALRSSRSIDVLHIKDGSESLGTNVKSLFRIPSGEEAAIQFGHTGSPVWAVAEVFGPSGQLLDTRSVTLSGRRAEKGSLQTVGFEYKSEWPDEIRIDLMYVCEGEFIHYTRNVSRSREDLALPLEFTRFTDLSAPHSLSRFAVRTSPGVQCAVSVFDKASESLLPNRWAPVPAPGTAVADIHYCFSYGRSALKPFMQVRGASVGLSRMYAAKDNSAEALEEAAVVSLDRLNEIKSEMVREDFSTSLCWEPALLSDSNGDAEFAVESSDKLSTFVVQVFAHDKQMHSSAIRREMIVSIPVQISLNRPQTVFSSDSLCLRPVLSNSSGRSVRGLLSVSYFDGKNYRDKTPLLNFRRSIEVPAGGRLAVDAPITVPQVENLSVLVDFQSEDGAGDALFDIIPVQRPVERLCESHSAILMAGEDKEALVRTLRASFVNFDGASATLREISLREMIAEALPQIVSAEPQNLVSLTDALYAAALARSLGGDCDFDDKAAAAKIVSCHRADGGFSWFEGMGSSPLLTALVLERFARMERRGLALDEALAATVPDAVRYLDKSQFSRPSAPIWRCHRLSDWQYMYVRSLYPKVKFKADEADSSRMSEFRKSAREYLLPGSSRGLSGMILAKARRALTLKELASSSEGLALARSWTRRPVSASRLERSASLDAASLVQYAQPHPWGGWYFPNAVMPWRGLLESELYAHSLLAGLLDSYAGIPQAKEVAEGVRLWMMVQKESQQWGSDPAFLEAVSTVLDASEETLGAKVLVLSCEGSLPLEEVRPSANGFTVERSYFRVLPDGRRELVREGSPLRTGDKLIAVYALSSGENRSFVRLTAPRAASMQPVWQLSGRIAANAYRNVLADKTEYWYDVFPEEKTVVEEELFVTVPGRFSVPAPSIESFYAPHYRANGASETTKVLPPM